MTTTFDNASEIGIGYDRTMTIAGHTFTLTAGETYTAGRPMARYRNQKFIVTIKFASDPLTFPPIHQTAPLTYDDANDLVNAFNNGETSWDGRVW